MLGRGAAKAMPLCSTPLNRHEPYAYRHLDGYNRDPALVVPALRYLLPLLRSTVNEDSTITVANRRYHDPLLAYWRGQQVEVRQSRHDLTHVYVYLDGEILCQAQEALYLLQ